MALYKTEAIVVQATPFMDTDKRVVLLTRDVGKLVGIAPHAVKSQKRFSGGLQSLTHLTVIYAEKRQVSLVRLQEVHIINAHARLKENLNKMAYGSYFLELISEVMREKESQAPLFDYLLTFLRALETSHQEELLSRLFEARLLPRIGWQPVLAHCLRCKQAPVVGPIYFSFLSGGVICRPCQSACRDVGEFQTLSLAAVHYLCHMMSGRKGLKAQPALGAELKRCLPLFLFHQLGKELRSYRFIQNVIAE